MSFPLWEELMPIDVENENQLKSILVIKVRIDLMLFTLSRHC